MTILELVVGTTSLRFRFHIDHGLLVEHLNFIEQFGIFLLDLFSILVNLLELFGELGQALQELLYNNDSKHEALAIPTESLDHKFQSNSLKDVIEQAILDNCSEEFGNFSEIYMGVLVQESVFVEESMKHASVNLLLFDNLRFLEALQGHNQLLDAFVDLVWLSTENVLEVFIGGLINFFRALSRTHLSWEKDRVLGH